MRKILGLFVMLAGILGLILSIAGLAGTWMALPVIHASAVNTLETLKTTLQTSDSALVVTDQALGNTVTSIDALAEMLKTTSLTVTDTQPVIQQVNVVLGDDLPKTLSAATDSLKAAEQAAGSLEGAIKSFESFRTLMSAVPFIGMTLPPVADSYNPEKSMADSLGELSDSIRNMPATFESMAKDLDKSDDNLVLIKTQLDTMSVSVGGVSDSLEQYRTMIGESRKSMQNLTAMITNAEQQLPSALNTVAIVLSVFLVWLLAAQIVIFSQGLELFNGTATHMGTQPVPAAAVKPAEAAESVSAETSE